MKKYIIGFCLLLQTAAFASAYDSLLELFGISPTAPTEEIVKETNRLWNQKNKERWNYDDRYENTRLEAWPLFNELGLIQAVQPQNMYYDYALVTGALLNSVKARIAFLSTQVKEGVQFDQIVFLTGKRPLLKSERINSQLTTEREMVEWLYEQSDLPKDIPVLFIDAPMQMCEGKSHRPSTPDTIALWLQTNPAPGNILLISNQPYLGYQKSILENLLLSDFTVEAVGSAIPENTTVALILDTIAKQLSWQNR